MRIIYQLIARALGLRVGADSAKRVVTKNYPELVALLDKIEERDGKTRSVPS